ncbi:MAG: hypothetical protein RQ729_10060 [Wenzhouxiangellaceae bacterium]|nr:hypothetical protein [Wenzhouxiangellaceae bacterium]
MTRARRPHPVLLLLLALAAFSAAAFYSASPVNRAAQDYARGVAAASAGLYVALRTLNAVLSTAQEVEVGGSFLMEASAQPFKVLEPIDDTIERIASVVFFVMVATGVIALAIGPVSAVGFGLIGLAALLGLLARSSGRPGASLVRPLGLHGVMLAVALPLSFLIASLLADWMTASAWEEHNAILAEISAEVEVGDVAPDDETAILGRWQDLLKKVESYATLTATFYDHADDLIASFIAILAVVLIKILVLPLIILGAFVVLGRSLARSSPRADRSA